MKDKDREVTTGWVIGEDFMEELGLEQGHEGHVADKGIILGRWRTLGKGMGKLK